MLNLKSVIPLVTAALLGSVATVFGTQVYSFLYEIDTKWIASKPLLTASMIAGGVTIFVGFLTFLGVWLSLRAAGKRMTTELSHAADQATQERNHASNQAVSERQHSSNEAHKERIATLRRTVYLEAIPELVKTQMYIGRLAKLDLINSDISTGFEGFLIAVAKVGIVSEQSTALKARAISSLFSSLLFKGIKTLMPTTALKADLDFYEKETAATQTELDRLIVTMKSHTGNSLRDQGAFNLLCKSHERQQERSKELWDKKIEIQKQLSKVQIEYSRNLMIEMRFVAPKLDELNHLIRLELGLESNLEEFQQQTTEIQKQMDTALQELAPDTTSQK